MSEGISADADIPPKKLGLPAIRGLNPAIKSIYTRNEVYS